MNFILGAMDILTIALVFQLSYSIVYSNTNDEFFFTQSRFLMLFLGLMPFWLIVLYLLKATEIPRTKHYISIIVEYFLSSLVMMVLLVLFYFTFKLYDISRSFIILLPVLGFILLSTLRILEYKVFKLYRAKGYNYINVVLLADESSLSLIESLIIHKEWGYRIAAIFTESEAINENYGETIIIIPEEYNRVLNDLMEVDMIDEIFYVKKKVVNSEVRNMVRSCEELGVVFRLMNNNKIETISNAIKSEIAEYKFLTFTNVPSNTFALATKKIMDIFGSLVAIILFSPLLLLFSILIKVDSPGPIIFKQPRVGLRGRHFDLYKFRTMVVNADEIKKELENKNEADGPVFKIKDDPRITRVGKILRRTGLDELPQLFNILKGEMSLIGPRPPLPSETRQYKRWQLRKLSVKPGLTCFWQIKPERNSIKFEKWMELDLAYIDNWSPRLDFIILLKTLKTIFQRTGL